MTRYQRVAAEAIKQHLVETARNEATTMYGLSMIADRTARQQGKKRELYPSLHQYKALLPPGSQAFWFKNLLYASNPNFNGTRVMQACRERRAGELYEEVTAHS